MTQTPYRAALFDLDGTLVDSAPDLAASANVLRQQMGLATLPLDQIIAMVGDGLQALLQRLLPPGSDLQQARQIFALDYSQQCTRSTNWYPGIAALLCRLHSTGWKLAVVSNKPQAWCQAILEHLEQGENLQQLGSPLWGCIIGGDGMRKPHPQPLELAMQELRVDPSETLMIGDHANDILAAQAAGCASVHVSWGYASLPEGLRPQYRCSSSEDLAQLLLAQQ